MTATKSRRLPPPETIESFAPLDEHLEVPPPAEAACDVQTGDLTAELGPRAQSPIPIPQSVTISVPIGFVPLNQVREQRYHLTAHVELQLLSLPQRVALRRLQIGLDQSGARLADGRRVVKNVDALRWVLEQVEAAVGGI
jgi:hypothetical protein